MDSKEIKRLASDTGGLDKAIDQMKVFTPMLTQEQFNASKEKAKDYQNKLHLINFNDRNTLLDLIEYTRNAALGYGITNILDNFCEEKYNKCLSTLS